MADLLSVCPNLNVLATSREPLHLAGEREYLVPPLREGEAVALFRKRAHVSEPEEAVLAICRRVDYLPLAVELAAARTKLLPPQALLQRLEKPLPLLTGGPRDAPERQRTLEATIAWSYDLLGESEKLLFARLSVFAGGCTLTAAEDVCDADLDTLQSLVEKNLLRHSDERFWMLETIRELALEKLEALEDADRLRHRHAEYVLESLRASDPERWDGADIARWRPEADNLRSAVEWALHARHADLALALATQMAPVGIGPYERGRWLDESLLLGEHADPALLAPALMKAAFTHFVLGDIDGAETLASRSLDDASALGDPAGQSKALLVLGQVAAARGEHDLARERLEQCLELADAADRLVMLHNLGELERRAGSLDRAAALLEEALHLALDAGHEGYAGVIQHGLGDTALAAGDTAAAERRYSDGLSIARDLRSERSVAYCLAGLAGVAAKQGRQQRAGLLWGASEAFQRAAHIELLADERAFYEQALDAVAGPEFERAARRMRDAEPDDALAAALAD